jgi:hypothetical protein
LEDPSVRERITKMDLRETGSDVVVWINLAQTRDQWQDANMVKDLGFQEMQRI